jgi:hypothetical protein
MIMKFHGYDILKIIVKKREISFRDILEMIPKKYRDHRDFISLASLCVDGYIDTTLPRMPDTLQYAEMFQAYQQRSMYGRVQPLDPDTENGRFYTLAKGDLYFHALHEKRIDRLYAFIIAIIIGVLTGITLKLF